MSLKELLSKPTIPSEIGDTELSPGAKRKWAVEMLHDLDLPDLLEVVQTVFGKMWMDGQMNEDEYFAFDDALEEMKEN